MKTTLKDSVREKMASGITDFRKVFDAITVDHPRNRKWPSWKTVQRYVREFQDELQASPQVQEANAVTTSPKDTVTDEAGSKRLKRTIKIRIHLRNLLTLVAQEVVPINTAMGMGLMPLLERLAKRGHELNDPELEECLDLLGF